jgi:hypothetical protein
MSFREEIARLLEKGELDEFTGYDCPGEIELTANEQAFLAAWMKSDEPALQENEGQESYVVEGAVKQRRIAMADGGRDLLMMRNTRVEGERKESLAAAKASTKAAQMYRSAIARRELFFMPELKGSQAPKLSWEELALVHEDSAVMLAKLAKKLAAHRDGTTGQERLEAQSFYARHGRCDADSEVLSLEPQSRRSGARWARLRTRCRAHDLNLRHGGYCVHRPRRASRDEYHQKGTQPQSLRLSVTLSAKI